MDRQLPPLHEAALRWFQARAGRIVTWDDLRCGPCRLVTAAKGIFKPTGQDYALSIRQTLESPYSDQEPEFEANGSWTYQYAQEGFGPEAGSLYTNQGMMACLRDGVPIGVLRQISKKPDATKYQILGIATVEHWSNEVFTVRSTVLGNHTIPEHFYASSPGEQPYGFDPSLVADARKKVLRRLNLRQGQRAFRSGLLTAYESRCAITGCEVEPVLHAAHITPYLGPQTNSVTNGLLLRSDIHALWDSGLIFLDPTLKVRLKPPILGSEYAVLAGKPIFIPPRREIQPSEFAVRAHREWSLADEK